MADSISGMLATLQAVEHELLLFAVFFFVLGTIDEFALDLTWLWLRITGRAKSRRVPQGLAGEALRDRAAVLIPAWSEAQVIGPTIAHMLKAWRQADYTIYVGCYRNDSATIDAAMQAAGNDPRVRLVIHDRDGPTTKADCLNRLYRALGQDEARRRFRYRSVVLHDAEDMVHPAALSAIDQALDTADFVQLPVRPEPQRQSRWIAGHYSDEFCEAHAKALVVRDALKAGIPAAGVGCGFAREALARLAIVRQTEGENGPFAAQCLTEDYELGLLLSREGLGSRFLRLRDQQGNLVATRSFFPAQLGDAVRQKTRWMHGIALQGWERLGWSGRPIDFWMALRDRRGPLTSLVLAVAYLLLLVELVLMVGRWAGYEFGKPPSPILQAMMWVTLFGLVWRIAVRIAFTTAEYGPAEGARALLRIPVANIIAIMAGRRALYAYIKGLLGETVVWEKTMHTAHPALQAVEARA
jgi:adsorption protein B